ncbi:BREX-1 system adenine-specific DNA-methyltransferase PglX, partial [Crocinitomicaceae bacterium]|nr:BREX-1 system adenine-specific DNA-methyltransferase PglX [Crocinitomicaceae bacterium]
NAIFHAKQEIIENCLFGVDINPNSVKICRLRLWIELLKNAYYTKSGVLQTLPNIDINIKCGNSLISRFSIEDDLKNAFKKGNAKNVKYTFPQYKNAVKEYKEAKSKEKKLEVLNIIEECKSNFKSTLDDGTIINRQKAVGDYEAEKARQANLVLLEEKITKADKNVLKDFKVKADQAASKETEIINNKIYDNAFEWRFEFPEVLAEDGSYEGFDVIIGNPPYIYNRDIDVKQRNFLNKKYGSSDDLYVYFSFEALNIIKPKGHFAYITPDTYFTLSTREKFRKTLLELADIKFTYSGFCFQDAYVETMIMLVQNDFVEDGDVNFVPDPLDYNTYQSFSCKSSIFKRNIYNRFFIPTKINLSLHSKINKQLFEVFNSFEKKITGRQFNNDHLNNYISELIPEDLTLLGVLSDGEQGLVTGNNSKYISQISENIAKSEVINTKFLAKLNAINESNLSLKEFNKKPKHYYETAELLKTTHQKPDLFGKFFIYKVVKSKDAIEFGTLSEDVKNNGDKKDLWVNYYKGNTEGYKWHVPYRDAINWNKTSVTELKDGVVTNSRWQGSKYYNTTGFGWVDYFTDRIKAFFIDEGIYSKNIVKLHSNSDIVSDKYIVALLNSKFISFYIKQFITTTHTLQINDGRLIPIKIPSKEIKLKIERIVDKIINSKKKNIDTDISKSELLLDELFNKVYGLTKQEVEEIHTLEKN